MGISVGDLPADHGHRPRRARRGRTARPPLDRARRRGPGAAGVPRRWPPRTVATSTPPIGSATRVPRARARRLRRRPPDGTRLLRVRRPRQRRRVWLDGWLPRHRPGRAFGRHLVWHSALHHLAVGDAEGALGALCRLRRRHVRRSADRRSVAALALPAARPRPAGHRPGVAAVASLAAAVARRRAVHLPRRPRRARPGHRRRRRRPAPASRTTQRSFDVPGRRETAARPGARASRRTSRATTPGPPTRCCGSSRTSGTARRLPRPARGLRGHPRARADPRRPPRARPRAGCAPGWTAATADLDSGLLARSGGRDAIPWRRDCRGGRLDAARAGSRATARVVCRHPRGPTGATREEDVQPLPPAHGHATRPVSTSADSTASSPSTARHARPTSPA